MPRDERAEGVYVVAETYPPDSNNQLYHVQHVFGDGVMEEVILDITHVETLAELLTDLVHHG